MAGQDIRRYLGLIDAALTAWDLLDEAESGPWTFYHTDLFDQTMATLRRQYPDLPARIGAVLKQKLPNPLAPEAKFGRHDGPLTFLPGYRHCHLAYDALLIYRLVSGRRLELSAVGRHEDIEGKRAKGLAKRLAA